MNFHRPIPILLTVPHLNPTASPYREMMAIVNFLPRSEFRLTVCSLRDGGFKQTAPLLANLGVDSFVARFRPTNPSVRGILQSYREQEIIDRRGPFAIQHSMDFTSSPFEALMARMRSRTYICSQRNLNQNGHRNLLKIKMRLSSRVIGISDAVCDFLAREGVPQQKISKIYLGLEIANIRAERRRGSFLCVGQIEPLKRQLDAVRAIAAISAEFPEARLAIAGNVYDKTYQEDLRSSASELGIADKIEFLGPREDILQLMAASHGVIHCCDREAFGWVIIEAMSVGTPVVACNAAGPREIIDDGRTGVLVDKGDVAGYAAALRRLLTEDRLVEHLSSNGRTEVETRYAAASMVEKIRSVYEQCVTMSGTSFSVSATPERFKDPGTAS
jgi:glycosyltransferase involved in cell wall biosynthesis